AAPRVDDGVHALLDGHVDRAEDGLGRPGGRDGGRDGAGRQVEALLGAVGEVGDDGLTAGEDVDLGHRGGVPDGEAALARRRRGGVVGEEGGGGRAVRVEVGDGGVVPPGLERQVDRAEDRLAVVGRVRGGERDGVGPGGELERAGEGGRLEVVEGELAVDVDVHGEVRDAVQHGQLCGVTRRGGGRGGEGEQRETGGGGEGGAAGGGGTHRGPPGVGVVLTPGIRRLRPVRLHPTRRNFSPPPPGGQPTGVRVSVWE